ncbi:hypothetical protein [Bacteroides ovatus]|uniref:hypothetical protein n=1 Tax=Bacteroides TaxID=816 RepID=UPI000E76E7F2|nr:MULTISPECIES: hypothetical protein [Bacteroides]KAB6606547.1 hypothetical protein GAZ68_00105 [Phocaeicola vulgatus]RJW94857.1 hypothetical protein DWZ80_02165 [Bacteroides sp. AF35-22]
MVGYKYAKCPAHGKRKGREICGRACGYVELLPAFHRPERDKATNVKQNEDKRYCFDTRTCTDRYICREV